MQRARLAVEEHDARKHGGVVTLDPARELVERLLERGGARDQLVDAVLGCEKVADPLGLAIGNVQPDDGRDRGRRVLERQLALLAVLAGERGPADDAVVNDHG